MRNAAVDACCLINLLAAGPAIFDINSGIAHGLSFSFHLPQIVTEETLYLSEPDEKERGKIRKVSVDLGPYFKKGLLNKCELTGETEKAYLVHLATQLDDGEAARLAIAKARGWSFATDDQKAIRIAAELNVSVVTTPELIRSWAKKTGASREEATKVIQRIQLYACYVPNLKSPEYAWWIRHLN